MIIIFFFYGLAFLLMGLIIFIIPKTQNALRLSDDLWLVGLFGLLHGLNEWVDLFLLRGKPFNLHALGILGGFLLPLSFLCLILFGTRVLGREKSPFQRLKYLWAACLAIWVAALIFGKGFLTAGIAARYFICIPGTFLSAYALIHAFLSHNKKPRPRMLSAAVWTVSVTFAVYGILSGLVVPKADFLLASVIHYPAFNHIIGLPVQFFRMLCSVILALGFSITLGVYSCERGKIQFRGGIRTKVLLVICSIVFLTAALSTGLNYGRSKTLLLKTLVTERKESADGLAALISNFLNEEIKDVRLQASSPRFIEAVQTANLKYGLLSASEIQQRLSGQDKVWINTPGNSSPLIKDCLEGPLGETLRRVLRHDDDLAEIFITDQWGGLVAASNRTSDFYQADENWWVRAFNQGKGAVYIDQIAYDASSQIMALPIAVPVKDQKDHAIGVLKAVLSIKNFTTPLQKFSIGKTGHAELLDDQGYNIFHPGIPPLSSKLYSDENFRQISQGNTSWLNVIPPHETDRRIVVSSEVENPWLRKSQTRWHVIINQGESEIFDPLKIYLAQAAGLSLLLLAIMIPLGFFAAGKIIRPLRKLQDAAKGIAEGALNQEIHLNTGDEIEALASAFHEMTGELKRTMVSRDALQKEITHRTRAEKEALEATRNWEDSFDAIEDMITIHDLDFNILRANKAAAAGLGMPLQEILTKKCFGSFHGSDCPPTGCPGCNVFKTGCPNTAEFFESHLNRFLEVKAMPRFDANHKLIGIVHIVRDITERKQIENALRESEGKHRTLFEGSHDALMLLAPPFWHFTEANAATLKMFAAKTKEEFLSIGPGEVSPKQQPDGWASEEKAQVMVETAMRTGSHFFEWTHQRLNGDTFPATVLLTRIQLGGETLLQATVRDITEIKQAEEQLTQALKDETRSREIMASMLEDNNKIREDLEQHLEELKKTQSQLIQAQKMEAVGKLAGGVAHDFNNLLTVISGYSELLMESPEAKKSFAAELQEIKNATERAKNLVKQLLAFGRRNMTAPKVFDPNVLLWDLEKMLRRLLPEHIEFVIKYADKIGTVKADPGQIEQILVNLVVNARDAMPQGGRIAVETRNVYLDNLYADRYANIPPGDYVMISVSDTGSGMTDEVKKHLFEPFFTTKPKDKGTGLGLATSYGLVRQNHGQITAYSELGQGTVIKLYLPHSSESLELLVSQKQQETLPGGTETLLVAEDEASLRKLTVSMLEGLGYKILQAANGQEALDLFHREGAGKVRLIITDVIMPVMTGRDLIEAVKKETKNIKVIFTSGYTDDAILHQGLLAGDINFIQKPFTKRALAFKVREILDKK